MVRHMICTWRQVHMKHRLILLLVFLCSSQLDVRAQATGKINVPFGNKLNPVLDVLGLPPLRTPLGKDSIRIDLGPSGHADLFMNKKRLWRVQQYDKRGRPLESGDLINGTGHVRLVHGRHTYEATLENGVLKGEFARLDLINGSWVPMMNGLFENGLLQGELRYRSLLDRRYVSVIEQYDQGVISMRETYGRRNWLYGFLWFLVSPVKDMNSICSRTIYERGSPSSHECLLSRKCRGCGT
jgi:hypothetical protein